MYRDIGFYKKNTLSEILIKTAKTSPDSVALVFPEYGGAALTYKSLTDKAYAVCRLLIEEKGVKKGDKVILCAERTPEWFLFFWGVIFSGAEAVIVTPEIHCDKYAKIKKETSAEVVFEDGTDIFSEVSDIFSRENSSVISDRRTVRECGSNDNCVILYTSGSEGEQKGVLLSHGSLLFTAAASLNRICSDSSDRWLMIAPLHHIIGIFLMMVSLISGASLYPLKEFTVKRAADAIVNYSLTGIICVPSIWYELKERVKRTGKSMPSLKRGVSDGAYLSDELLEDIYNILEIKNFCPAYGLTESSGIVSCSGAYDPLSEKKRSSGLPLEGTMVMIKDSVTGETITKPGISGTLYISGGNMMSGYCNCETPLTDDGFFCTGDIAMYNEFRGINICGRIKELIIRCGENISPLEIEKYLLADEDISCAAVVSEDDEACGERIVCFVVPSENAAPTKNGIMNKLAMKIEEFKLPDDIIFVDEFIKTSSGKTDKLAMKRKYLSIHKNSGHSKR